MRCVRSLRVAALLLAGLLLCSSPAWATPKVHFASTSWTGVTIKTQIGMNVLRTLGYQVTNNMLSVPIVYEALSLDEADVFLGNWMPSMANIAQKHFDDGSVIKYVANMKGAKYTLAVPDYVYEAGLQDFADIAQYADKLDHKIYGIEEGNDGNKIIEKMIRKDMFGLGDFEVVASSEPGMLSQVQSFARKDKWIVFLGWSPHYMNEVIDMRYLSGSTPETFGPHNGTATVYTNTRDGFAEDQPNVAKFLRNFTFPVAMMNEIMHQLHENKNLQPLEAAKSWLRQHPQRYQQWLQGVTTVAGQPALPAFEQALQQQ